MIFKFDKRNLIGRKITRIEMNRFRADGHGSPGLGRWAHDPAIYLDNGKVIRFLVQETEVGRYGISMSIVSAEDCNVEDDRNREGESGSPGADEIFSI